MNVNDVKNNAYIQALNRAKPVAECSKVVTNNQSPDILKQGLQAQAHGNMQVQKIKPIGIKKSEATIGKVQTISKTLDTRA